MKSLYTYIVEPLHGKLYNNVKKFEGGELITSSSIENHTTTNRYATVLAPPEKLNTPVIKGATIIVHHNVFRKYNDMKGIEQYAAGLIKDNMYMVDPYQVFMYRNPGEEKWTTLDPYCFISPVDNDIDLHNGSEKEMYGVMEYPNTYMNNLGLKKGDLIAFKTDSEYEFNIEGKKYYRVNSNNICLTK
jgi:hypothetical protein|tara:strand:+ start:2785 stop:3348 length:564 start_codon:yes stop_codon:yes gene_type:complete